MLILSRMQPSAYYETEHVEQAVAQGQHRDAIGGLWDALGELQLQFLKNHGLQTHHRLLDIGCGALRLGVRAIEYLDAGNYFGADISESLMRAGYEKELDDALREKCPWEQFHQTEDFDFNYLPQPIDMAMAQSVFTHLPLNHIRQCLARLAPQTKAGGCFFATGWIVPEDHPVSEPFTQPGSLDGEPIVTYPTRDSYHYRAEDYHYAAKGLPWKLDIIGDWNHPRGQQMLSFTRL